MNDINRIRRAGILAIGILSRSLSSFARCEEEELGSGEKTNIVFILADDK